MKANRTIPKLTLACGFAASIILAGLVFPSWAEMGELEMYIRARIEIGEKKVQYMNKLGPLEPSERTTETVNRISEEVGAMVEGILSGYGLTKEEYEEKGPVVFLNKTAVDKFFRRHPDLKQRYNALPMFRGSRDGRIR